jgi:hypothetical protein
MYNIFALMSFTLALSDDFFCMLPVPLSFPPDSLVSRSTPCHTQSGGPTDLLHAAGSRVNSRCEQTFSRLQNL